MSPETEGNSPDLTTAKDRLIGIGKVGLRALGYTPRSVRAALVGTGIGTIMVGLAFMYQHSPDPNPQIPKLYDLQPKSGGNRFATDHALLVLAGFAGLAVIFDLATPWLDRKLTSWDEERQDLHK